MEKRKDMEVKTRNDEKYCPTFSGKTQQDLPTGQ